ncbi:hypothetical protein [Deinococcus phoenicis]|uniref:hypothetical protein n=1 Tax=Deinococcus phoenicis TaxID=1476583 RepID=UPI0005523A53|nr:hypothetical protein [Deinococcus phoenicis]
MRHLVPLAAALTSSALAAPLIGSSASFAASGFCKTYACKLSIKDPLGADVSEYRYIVKGEFPFDPAVPMEPTVLSVVRQGERVVSLGYTTGVQDTLFGPGETYTGLMISRLVELGTGKRPTPTVLFQLNTKCEEGRGKEVFIPWSSGGKTYRLSCTLSHEYVNAWRLNFRVY